MLIITFLGPILIAAMFFHILGHNKSVGKYQQLTWYDRIRVRIALGIAGKRFVRVG